MQDNFMQAQMQPFIKLAQSNMELLTRFSTAPEITAQPSANANNLLQQATDSATGIMQSGAFVKLMEGFMKNYAVFLTEVSQSTMGMMAQGQQAFTRQAQDATEQVIEATDLRKSRARNAA